MGSNLSMITQEQFAWLYEQAKLTVLNDGVLEFFDCLANENNLIFSLGKARNSLYKDIKYVVPSDKKDSTEAPKETTKSNLSIGDTCYILKSNKLLKDKVNGIAIGKCGEYRSEEDIYYFGRAYFSNYNFKNVFRTKEEAIKSLLGED